MSGWAKFLQSPEEEEVQAPVCPFETIYHCMDILRDADPDAFELIIKGKAMFCYPPSLCPKHQRDPSWAFITRHLFLSVPEEQQQKLGFREMIHFQSHDETREVSVSSQYLFVYEGPLSIPKRIDIEEEIIVNLPCYESVKVTFVSKCLGSEWENQEETETPLYAKKIYPDPLKKKSPKTHSMDSSRGELESELRKASLTSSRAEFLILDYFGQLNGRIKKYADHLHRYSKWEASYLQRNQIHSHVSWKSVDWAIKNLYIIQTDSILCLASQSNRGNLDIQRFSHLYQPLENYILGNMHDTIMDVLIQQNRYKENKLQEKLNQMRKHPTTHQPESVTPQIRALPLFGAAREFNNITSEKGKTPKQKLLCLQKSFIELEASILEIPSSIEDEYDTYLRDTSLETKLTFVTSNRRDPSLPEMFRRMNCEYQKQRSEVINLVYLLIINHAPSNFLSHMSFITFQTVQQEKEQLHSFHTLFMNCIHTIMNTTSHPEVNHPPPTKQSLQNIVRYQTFSFGETDYGTQETYPVIWSGGCSKDIVSMYCGKQHILGITEDGELHTSGCGSEGQLGHGDETTQDSFKKIDGLSSQVVTEASGGGGHSAALTKNGILYSWGCNRWGQTGVGFDCEKITVPTQIDFKCQQRQKVVKISCGDAHNLALLSNGTVWSWGLGVTGQLGHGDLLSYNSPKQIEFFNGEFRVMDICCGWNHSICVTRSNKVYTFGLGTDGQLGHGINQMEISPRLLRFDFGEVLMCSAFNHNLLLSTNGFYSWGWGEHGELGRGDKLSLNVPKLVKGIDHTSIRSIDAGAFHSSAVTFEGIVYSWGSGESGQLGHGDHFTQTTPYHVSQLKSEHIISVVCGFNRTFVIQVTNSQTAYRDLGHDSPRTR